ncbi:hypothetical protein GIB67_005084 [Kingdonia uniflora]|uniref:Glycosyltransferase N-terminal domain-containing protein n=1 Tax=Kingdonia uniflora TaxID=39325 RepID=A0A7J7KUS7_9MAGN|nr:hypothetical protein GIB67_005084 [Kingdonia uniflora]
MTSVIISDKPHAVCIPFPAQGHINPMLKLAKLLHHKGFHITFVNTEFNNKRLLKSVPEFVKGLPDFQFGTIPDGLPPSDVDATQDIPALCDSLRKNCVFPFRDLLAKLNNTSLSKGPPVSCIVSDGVMSFTLQAAEELGIPEVLFWTFSAPGFMAYLHYPQLIQRGLTPFKALKEVDRNFEVKEELYKIRKGFFGRIDNQVIDQDRVSIYFQEAEGKRTNLRKDVREKIADAWRVIELKYGKILDEVRKDYYKGLVKSGRLVFEDLDAEGDAPEAPEVLSGIEVVDDVVMMETNGLRPGELAEVFTLDDVVKVDEVFSHPVV